MPKTEDNEQELAMLDQVSTDSIETALTAIEEMRING